MRKLSRTKKIVVAGAAATALAVGGGIAFAYWTTTGSGEGTATAAGGNGTITLYAAFDSSYLAPGLSESVHFTADNPGTSDLQVGTVHSVVSTSDAGCLPAWFSIDDVVEDQVIEAGATGVDLDNDGTLVFHDSATVNQDACKGATITLTLSS